MKVNLFAAKCITNLHVGNGDVNYSIIDQEVERDPVTGWPVINASGVKGAVREFFEARWGKDDIRVKKYFGSGKDDTAQGSYVFLQADILFVPLRVSDGSSRSYVLATTDEILRGYSKRVEALRGIGEKVLEDSQGGTEVEVEGDDKKYTLRKTCGKWNEYAAQDCILVPNLNVFDLPVIARNVLDDNGISKNLWYEEYVPHESVFSLIILTPNEMDDEFRKLLTSEPVQFGGNASIGYGLMGIREVR